MNPQSLLNVSGSHSFLPEPRREEVRGAASPITAVQRTAMLLGLPCAHCRAYYGAELNACPICGCAERVWQQLPSALKQAAALKTTAIQGEIP